jgi:murein DD-endopeptidase MepM/ murein hydrolase activator NlpD
VKTIALLLIVFLSACMTTPTDRYIADLKGGRVINDTTPVYVLPYANGTSHLLIQGYHSKMSHKGEYALDFKMKVGSEICAARDGIVIAIKEDSDIGGLKDEYLSQGNHIIIQHADNSQAMYWHLKKDGVVVSIGETVKAGQLIGYSGNTGYSAFPHLHFEVNANTTNGFEQVPTRFYTNSGVRYLRPGNYYRASHQ